MDQAQTALPAEALRLRDAVSRRLHDVYHVQIPRLSECKDVSEYETELHETLQRIASLVQQMADDIDDAESAAERAALKTLVDTNRHELMRVRQASRRALLAAHRATASRQEASARSALLSHAARQNSGVRAAPMDRASATSEQVTGALQRTVKLMSSELEKSGYSTQLLTESSETIAQVSNKYASFNDLLRDSVSMIRQMERAELVDLGILGASITFFLACVLYILYARIFSRGIHALSLTWHASSSIGSSALGLFSALQHREPQRVSRERDPIEEAIRFASSQEAVPRRHRKHAPKSADKPWVDVVELTASPTPPSRSESPGSFSESSASPLPADLPDSAHADDRLAETSPAFLSPTEKAVTASAAPGKVLTESQSDASSASADKRFTDESATLSVSSADAGSASISAIPAPVSSEDILTAESPAFLVPSEDASSTSSGSSPQPMPTDDLVPEKSATFLAREEDAISASTSALSEPISTKERLTAKSTTFLVHEDPSSAATSTGSESVPTDKEVSESTAAGQKRTDSDPTSTIPEPIASETPATMATSTALDFSGNHDDAATIDSVPSSSSDSTLHAEPTSSEATEMSSPTPPHDLPSSSERRRRPWDEL